jgi:hypothetical protein
MSVRAESVAASERHTDGEAGGAPEWMDAMKHPNSIARSPAVGHAALFGCVLLALGLQPTSPAQDRTVSERLALYDPAGELSDEITFGVQDAGISEGRWPDGASAEFRRFKVPTPGSANGVGDPALPCRLLSLTLAANGDAVLSCTAAPGMAYRLQYKNDLREANWSDAGETIATGARAILTNVASGQAQRFYRVQGSP